MEIADWLVVGQTAECRGMLSQTGGGFLIVHTIMERMLYGFVTTDYRYYASAWRVASMALQP
jgi:hypothetical protein